MEEKRCPICKKFNPPGEDTCLFCGNSLIPGETPLPGDFSGEEIEVPEWLKDFKDSHESDTPADSDPVDHTPEWLQRIRDLNDQKQERRPGYPESVDPELETDAENETPPVNPSGLQEWLNKLHRLEVPKESSSLNSGRGQSDGTEYQPKKDEPSIYLPESETEFSGDYVEEILSEELTALPDEESLYSSTAGEGKEAANPEPADLPVQISEESLMAEIDDYKSEPLDDFSSRFDLLEPESSSSGNLLGVKLWIQKLTAIFGTIPFLKPRKSTENKNEVAAGELEAPEPEMGEEFTPFVEETIPPDAVLEIESGAEDTIDLQIEEGQQELTLAAGLLDAPGNLPGSMPDPESKEFPAVSQPAGQEFLASPDFSETEQPDNLVTQFTTPAGSARLINLTEKQRVHRDLLQDLLRAELEPSQLPDKPGKLSNRLLRWFIALIVIAALVYPFVSARAGVLPVFTLPVTPQQQSFFQEIENLPDNSAVLVAFEYEAAFSGEMRGIAINTVEHLVKRNARLAFVSTLPAGPILAEDVYSQTGPNSSLTASEAAGNYVNLGYLPGGVASLRQFSIQPKQASLYGLSSAIDKQPSWTKPALRRINRLSDFSIVIVMTDNVETGKAWLEQVQPVLGETPLLFVTSAQAGPVLTPYLFSGQAQGIISGYPGNLVYAQLLNKGLGNPVAFLAYRTGMYLLLVALVVGGFLKIYNSILSKKSSVQGRGSM